MSYAYTDDRVSVFTFPYVTTVFSASNYCGTYGNKAAVVVIVPDELQVGTSIYFTVWAKRMRDIDLVAA